MKVLRELKKIIESYPLLVFHLTESWGKVTPYKAGEKGKVIICMIKRTGRVFLHVNELCPHNTRITKGKCAK